MRTGCTRCTRCTRCARCSEKHCMCTQRAACALGALSARALGALHVHPVHSARCMCTRCTRCTWCVQSLIAAAMKTYTPRIRVATHKSKPCCCPGVHVSRAEVSQLWCLGVPGVVPRVLCTHVLHCLWLSRLTSHACCRTVRASLRLLKRSFGLRCRAGLFFGPWACMVFYCVPCRQHLGIKRTKTWMKDATCRSSMRSLQKAKRVYHGPKIGATNLEAGIHILILWPLFWGRKMQTGAIQ